VNPKRLLVILAAAAALIALVLLPTGISGAPTAPTGVTGIAQASGVTLAWQPVTGADGYTVYRGTSLASITTRLTPATGVAATSYSDTGLTNGTAYYYAVRSVSGGVESGSSLPVQVTPRARGCSTGNAVVVENCYPGDTGWKLQSPGRASDGGIEGYATAPSINRGGSVDLKVDAPGASTLRFEIYRSGYYGGAGARLYSVLRNVPGGAQDACAKDSSTGLVDCSNWSTTATLTTTSAWPTGVYLIRVVREDNNSDTHILLVVRDDASHSDLLYGLPVTSYQAYNAYQGRSLYDYNSFGDNTVAGTPRAVKVSLDRPYYQSVSGEGNWFTKTDYASVYWMERSGYDLSYASNTDLEQNGSMVGAHKAYVSGVHDEYWSSAMRSALQGARNAGTDLFFLGANEVYWKVRYENGPGGANTVMVCYKTTQSGPADPSGIPTGTWRDPNGANQPENGLTGIMYVGDNDGKFFPMHVTAAQGSDPVWRHTELATLAPGTSEDIGTNIVGWEWDARVANGAEPPGVITLAASPVSGNLIQGNGAFVTPGSTTVNMTKYVAGSGALVVATGTNQWFRGLATTAFGVGEPDVIFQQATTNILADMGALPSTPASNIVLDASSPPSVVLRNPADGATDVDRLVHPTATFSRTMDASTITASSFTLTPNGGSAVAATVSYDATSRTATLTPTTALAAATTYTARLTTAIKAADGTPLSSASTWTFTTAAAQPVTVTGTTPADGATGISVAVAPTATFNRSLNPATVNGTSVTLTRTSGSVAATVSYDDATKRITITPNQALAFGVQYTARIAGTVAAPDGVTLGTAFTWRFTTAATPPPAPTVTTTSPADGATGVARGATVTATFSRSMDPATLTGSTFTLTGPSGAVAATVAYDDTSRTATLTPSAPLAYSAAYTARITTGARAADGTPMAAAVSWGFTVQPPPPPPTVTGRTPADGATAVPRDTAVTATFSRDMSAASISATSFTVAPTAGGPAVAASVSYDPASDTATLTPTQPLTGSTAYTATLDTTVAAADGTPLAAPVTWSFTTAVCPCSLYGPTAAPASTNNPVRDGRVGTGPWSYELGVKVNVDQSSQLTAIKYFKSTLETGTHVGRVWSSSGVQIGSVTFQNETASGWQRQKLSAPIGLEPGQTYVVSVNANAVYAFTPAGLATQIDSGPLHSVVGTNGVYGASAGTFPTASYNSSSYFTDLEVMPSATTAPAVIGQSPADGATGVARNATVTATFSRAMDPASLTTSTVTLTPAGGSAVPATVAYDGASKTVTLTPSSPLAYSTVYTAKVSTGATASDGTPMASASTWQFTTLAATPLNVTGTNPANNATGVAATANVRATFSKSLKPASVTAQSVTLTGPSGAVAGTVSYDDASKTVTLSPSAPMAAGSYTARLAGTIEATDDTTLGTAFTWTFSVAAGSQPLSVTASTPGTGATGVARSTTVTATFSKAVDPTTLTTGTFRLVDGGGTAVPATVTYDGTSRTATLTPNANLAASAGYTAQLTTAITATDGAPLGQATSWSFTTGPCDCSLFAPTATPASTNNPTRDGRPLPGPWTYELGVKVTVDQPVSLRAVRFFKSTNETGTHTGRIWAADGTPLGTVTFANETASGWQQANLATPIALTPGQTYVVSVNANAVYAFTGAGLATQIVSGPLRSVVGTNGVFGASAGTFPTASYNASNYFVDVVVR
jgi:methionine-rich copper-binding protein CopC